MHGEDTRLWRTPNRFVKQPHQFLGFFSILPMRAETFVTLKVAEMLEVRYVLQDAKRSDQYGPVVTWGSDLFNPTRLSLHRV